MLKSTVLLLGLLLLFSCKNKFETIRPSQEKITESVYASGIIKSSNQYEVYSTVSGLVAAVMVTEGDVLKKGDTIMQLNSATARMNTENAGIAAAYAAKTANTEKLGELKSNIGLATMQVENTSLQLKRQQNLWSQQIGTRNELDQRELLYKSALNALAAAKLRYTQLEKQISFQAKQSATNLALANLAADDYTIKAATDGKIYNLLKKKGEMVNPQTAVALVGDAQSFELELQVDEYDIERIQTGQRVMLNMESYKDHVFEAVVKKIMPLMNEQSKSFTVKAVFTSRPPALYPGLTCETNIIIHIKEKALTIPRACLLEGDYVLLENKEKRKVSTGLKDYQKVEITSGLNVTDKLLTTVP